MLHNSYNIIKNIVNILSHKLNHILLKFCTYTQTIYI